MRIRLAVGVTAAAVVLGGVSAGGVAAAASSDKGGTKTIVVTARQTAFAAGVHSGAHGSPAPGDTFVIGQQLRNTAGDAGIATIACTVAFHNDFTCQADIALTGRGHIELGGLITSGRADLAVTGGTGEFRSAAGEATIIGVGHVDQQLIIHLR